MKKQTILVIGDLHAPYMHPDAVRFLRAIKSTFKPTEIVFMGDEVDNHAMSYHEHDPDLDSPKTELAQARAQLKPLFEMFPKATVLESNHGSLVYRKAMTAGIPSEVLKGYREILGAPKGWNWKFEHISETALGPVYFHHGKTAAVGKLSQNMGMSACQGHYHSKFYVSYWSSPRNLFFDANVGCLVDKDSRAAAYGKLWLQKPIVGVGLIINGNMTLVPMALNSKGRWTGKL